MRKFLLALAFFAVFSGGRVQTPAPFSLVSVNPAGAPGNGPSNSPALSGDGRFVAFVSAASDLVEGDTNGFADVFVYDRLLGVARRVSVSSTGEQANGASSAPAISANGRVVAFVSAADNLVPGDTNGAADAFTFDLLTGQTRRVSVNAAGAQVVGDAASPSVSGDGRWVAFLSGAANLVRGDTNESADVFLFDQVTGNVIRASVSSEGVQANAFSAEPVISGDGRFVAFVSAAGNLAPGDTNGLPDVFVFHRVLGQTRRVSVGAGGQQGRAPALHPSISAAGGLGTFVSLDETLAPGGQPGWQVYLFGAQGAPLARLAAAPAHAGEVRAALASGGQVVAYRVGAGAAPLFVRDVSTMMAASQVFGGALGPVFAVSASGMAAAFSSADAGLGAGGVSQVLVSDPQGLPLGAVLAGRVTDALGSPLALVTLVDSRGNATRTDAGGYFWLAGSAPGPVTLTPSKEGYAFSPESLALDAGADALDLRFTATPEKVLAEARLDLGMPYSFHRGCEDPYKGCGKRFHGFSAGYCTDLVLDAYRFGADYAIQFELEQDAKANPAHFYRWRDARNAQDMWRYFSYAGQMHRNDAPYALGDLAFFDWTEDGEIDHVALVSEVEAGRPTRLLDAAGVTAQNPSGLAADLPWEAFHDRTVRGHARWRGTYEPYVPAFPAGQEVLQLALGASAVSARLVDGQGRAVSLTEQGIPGGEYLDLLWEKVIGVVDPLAAGGQFTLELYGAGPGPAAYRLTVQTLQEAVVPSRFETGGVLAPGEVRRVPLLVAPDPAGRLVVSAQIPLPQAKIRRPLR